MSQSRRVLITGSRAWTNNFLIHNMLTSFHWMLAGDNDITLVSGGCPTGADVMCEQTARELGWKLERHPAQWEFYGRKAAGPIRNHYMVERGADVCLAFILDDSKGATMTADLAEKAGIETLRFKRYTNGLPATLPDEKGDAGSGDPDILRTVENLERSNRLLEGARV